MASSKSGSSSFQVALRLRPLLTKERKESAVQCVNVEMEHRAVVITKPVPKKQATQIEINDFSGLVQTDLHSAQNFFFDTVFGPNSTQQDVYNVCARHIILSVLEGYNGSVIAYGQTGTGKSFTIEGGDEEENRGLIPRSSEEIFSYIKNTASMNDRFLVRVSFLEIYNEKISDLLDPVRTNLRLREDGTGGTYVENLSEQIVKSTNEIKLVIKRGTQSRTTAETRSNTESSRSHAIFTIIVEHAQSSGDGNNVVTIGKLRLADLAGSERLDVESQSKRQQETKSINTSLLAFGKVVMALTSSSSSSYIPYRDSKLTKILQDSLGGNCKTTMITTISPTALSYTETLNSLKFAKRAKHVKNNAIINKDVSEKAMLSAYQQEIKKLREQLQRQGTDNSPNTHQLSKLEQEKQKAEQLKDRVLSELEQQKLLFNQAEKEKLEYQKLIEQLEAKLLHGGSDFTESSEFKRVLEVEREKIVKDTKQEYEQMIAKLEEEKKRLQRDKAEIEKERLRLQIGKGPSTDQTSSMFKRPNLPAPTLATRQPLRQSPLIGQTPTAMHSNQPKLFSSSHPNFSSQVPIRRPNRAASLTPAPLSTAGSYTGISRALQDYYLALADPCNGIPCQELKSGVRIFSGNDAVQWFVSNMEGVSSMSEAERIGQRLIELGMISEVQGGDQFIASESVYYQFCDFSSFMQPATLDYSRPGSAFSMMSIHSANPAAHMLYGRQSKTASLPVVNSIGLDSSLSLSSSPSLATLQLTSPVDIMETHGLTNNNPTQLHLAAISGDIKNVYELSKSLDVNTLDNQGYSPLMYAVLGNQPKCCNVLIKNLQSQLVNLKETNGNNTALMIAIIQGYAEVAKVLLKNHADTHHVDENGNNVFHIATKSLNTRCLQVLLKYSSNLVPANERNHNNETPLLVAVMAHQHSAIKLLLKHKCDPGISDMSGQTPLHRAVMVQRCGDCVQAIVTMAPNEVNLVDINGLSALHIAAQLGLQQVIESLLQSPKCDMNMQSKEQRTALHYAVLADKSSIAKLLLLNGANRQLTDVYTMTAEDYAIEKKQEDCIATFRQ